MRIVILMGSTDRKGSASILAENFKKGAEENSHTVYVIDVCHANIRKCTNCVQRDDSEHIRKALYPS